MPTPLGRDVQLAEAAVWRLEKKTNCKMTCKPRLSFASVRLLSA
jgi:hypothetical protein